MRRTSGIMTHRSLFRYYKTESISPGTYIPKKAGPKPGSTPWFPTNKRLNAKPIWRDNSIVETNIPSIYGCGIDGSDHNISTWSTKTKDLFNLTTEYIPPVSFQYKLPSENVPEFAFVGRSNVGKSSLINSLLDNKTLVRVSKEPGCTRNANYYGFIKHKSSKPLIANEIIPSGRHSMFLIDLPGIIITIY
jgi:hypothetical protein